MGKEITYRHNVMGIHSLDAFLNVKGGFCQGRRDVYFIRALGGGRELGKEILAVDEKMELEMQKNRLFYTRVSRLLQLTSLEDAEFYQQQYARFKTEEKLRLKNLKNHETFERTLGKACLEVLDKYRLIKNTVTESMERNFAVKLLYWTDCVLGEALADWNERKCFKILADNVYKEQEYLFYFMLTLIGCDVLLLECREDIAAPDVIKALSGEFRLGEYHMLPIPEYRPVRKGLPMPEAKTSQPKPSAAGLSPQSQGRREIKTSPNRNGMMQANKGGICRNPQGQKPVSSVKASPAQLPRHLQPPISGNGEKSFEELALLASSIVMIEVHDRTGRAVSTGSGIMIGKDGYILTNHHVAGKGSFFAVRIEDEDAIYRTDEMIKYNSVLDLAVIRIGRMLKPLPVYQGGKKLVRGQKVVAIGSPLGLFNSVSDGIISGFRKIDSVDMIQFTAPISHGSSGGAVLNMQGEVIGISTAGIDQGQNLNLAVDYQSINLFVRGFV